ncbi:MAG: efflux RND transporter periplasmic adaptor subunit [Opitutaceae bacterium]|nr:efflux RND transporter periplasmic adaptor subunit [Opitutaceae bacterium]
MKSNTSNPHSPRWLFAYGLPPLIILIAVIVAFGALKLKPDAAKKMPEESLPVVKVIEVKVESIQLEIVSQGTVQARTETNLIAEVSGRILHISPALFAGGFFKKGDELVQIDPIDYEANLANALGGVAEAKLNYQQEKANSDQAKEDWAELQKGDPNDLVLRKPQLERALANMAAAKAAVKMAQRDLERTTVRAPYDGRVRKKLVDLGQMVSARSSQIAQIYSVDIAEIRLPLSLDEIHYLDLPEQYPDDSENREKPQVTIEAFYAGQTYQWKGIIDRTEGTIDPKTRLTYVVAQIIDPYDRDQSGENPPLKVGMFVEAHIKGKTIASAMKFHEVPCYRITVFLS